MQFFCSFGDGQAWIRYHLDFFRGIFVSHFKYIKFIHSKSIKCENVCECVSVCAKALRSVFSLCICVFWFIAMTTKEICENLCMGGVQYEYYEYAILHCILLVLFLVIPCWVFLMHMHLNFEWMLQNLDGRCESEAKRQKGIKRRGKWDSL